MNRETNLDLITNALEECREYFDQRADAECDPSGPGYTGNEEMRLLVHVEEAIRAARRMPL